MKIVSFPTDVEEFRKLRDEIARTPEGGAAAFAVALCVYGQDPTLGMQLLTVAIDQGELIDGTGGVGGRRPRAVREFQERNGRSPHVARSMFQGTTPENGYTLPPFPLEILFKIQAGDVQEAEARVFVITTGADSPKPMRLRKNDKGIWKAVEWSSFQGNCRPPVVKRTDDL